MFQLHDRTRRWITLTAFVVLALLPTVIVLAYGVIWRLPQHVQAEAERLGDRIGMKVSMRAIRHLRPGLVRYEGLELLNPETGRPVLRCGTLQAGWDQIADDQGHQQPALVLSATDPEIDTAQVEQLWRLADRLFLGRADGPLEVRLACGDLQLRLGENRQTLRQPGLAVTTDSLGTQVELRFRLPGGDSPAPVRLRVARDRRRPPPLTRFDLDTGGAAMPCWLLATGLPSFEGLGSEGRYCGVLWAALLPQGWEGGLKGRFNRLDLDRLVTDRFPHKLSGLAEVTIRQAEFHQGRLVKLDGSINAGPGVVSRSLVDDSAQFLRCVAATDPGMVVPELPYQLLAATFLLDHRGLQLHGLCQPEGSRVILTGPYRWIVGEPDVQPQPLAGLLQTLIPVQHIRVPAGADWLFDRLPMSETAAIGVISTTWGVDLSPSQPPASPVPRHAERRPIWGIDAPVPTGTTSR
jgi:hypothetical protein